MGKNKKNNIFTNLNYNSAYTDSLFSSQSSADDDNTNVNINMGANDDWEFKDKNGNMTITTPQNVKPEDQYKKFLESKNATNLIQGGTVSSEPTLQDKDMDLMQKHDIKDYGTRAYNYGPINRLFRYGVSGLFKEDKNDYYDRRLSNAQNKEENIIYKAAKNAGIEVDDSDLFENEHAGKEKLQSQIDWANTYSPGNYGQIGKDKLGYDEIIEKYGSEKEFESEMQRISDENTAKIKEDLDPKIEEVASGLPLLEDGSKDYTRATEIYDQERLNAKTIANEKKFDDALAQFTTFNEEGTTKSLENKKTYLTEALKNAGYEDADVKDKLENLFNIDDTHTGRVDLSKRLDEMISQSEGQDTPDDTSDDKYTLGALSEDDPDKKRKYPQEFLKKKETRDTELGGILAGLNTTAEKKDIYDTGLSDFNDKKEMLHKKLSKLDLPTEVLDNIGDITNQEELDAAIEKIGPMLGTKKGMFGKNKDILSEAYEQEAITHKTAEEEKAKIAADLKLKEEKEAADLKIKEEKEAKLKEDKDYYGKNIVPGSRYHSEDTDTYEEYIAEDIKTKGPKAFMQRLLPGGKSGLHSEKSLVEQGYDYQETLKDAESPENIKKYGSKERSLEEFERKKVPGYDEQSTKMYDERDMNNPMFKDMTYEQYLNDFYYKNVTPRGPSLNPTSTTSVLGYNQNEDEEEEEDSNWLWNLFKSDTSKSGNQSQGGGGTNPRNKRK